MMITIIMQKGEKGGGDKDADTTHKDSKKITTKCDRKLKKSLWTQPKRRNTVPWWSWVIFSLLVNESILHTYLHILFKIYRYETTTTATITLLSLPFQITGKSIVNEELFIVVSFPSSTLVEVKYQLELPSSKICFFWSSHSDVKLLRPLTPRFCHWSSSKILAWIVWKRREADCLPKEKAGSTLTQPSETRESCIAHFKLSVSTELFSANSYCIVPVSMS